MIVRVEAPKCIGCSVCVDYCPMGAIEMKDGVAHVIENLCRGCQACQMACPQMAIVEDREATQKRMSGGGRGGRRW